MLKNYFSVRVYVIVDACLLALWTVTLVNGWTEFAKYQLVAAIVWCVLTIPLAIIGLISVYQRLQLHHRKNVHTQWEYEQQSEIRLTQLRQQYALSPPQMTVEEEKILLANRPDKRPVQLSSPDMSSGQDTMSSQMSSSVQFGEDEVEAPVYTPMEQSILDNERKRQNREAHKTDEQMGIRWGVSSKTIQRTRDAMKQANKL